MPSPSVLSARLSCEVVGASFSSRFSLSSLASLVFHRPRSQWKFTIEFLVANEELGIICRTENYDARLGPWKSNGLAVKMRTNIVSRGKFSSVAIYVCNFVPRRQMAVQCMSANQEVAACYLIVFFLLFIVRNITPEALG